MGNFIVNLCNNLISGLGVALQAVFLLLPESPFTIISSKLPDFIFNIEWLIPVSEMLATAEAWIGAILTYYLYQTVLRWMKAIE